MIIAKSTPTISHDPVPAGTHVARCVEMIHLGSRDDEYQGRTYKSNKVRITWELPLELKVFNPEKGEQPYVVSKEFSLTMSEKSNLRAFLTSWRGKGFTEDEARAFDVTKLLGVPCMLSIIHEPGKKDPSKMYERIASVSTLPKGMVCPPQINPTRMFSLDKFDESVFLTLPDWIKDIIRESDEYKAIMAAESAHPTFVDSSDDEPLPF